MGKIFLAMQLVSVIWAYPAYADLFGLAQIIDGDTVKIEDVKIRLHGIDAPETKQFCNKNGTKWPCGVKATLALKNIIANKNLTCKKLGQDRFRRIIAKCSINGKSTEEEIVRLGFALAYRKYSKDYIPPKIFPEKKSSESGLVNSFLPGNGDKESD